MNKIGFFVFGLWLLAFGSGYAQKGFNIPVNQRVILNYTESVVYAEVLTNENKVKPSDDLFYFWFGANDIKKTRGGFDGKLLHGIYSEFYLNKNLKEKGNFKYGLKNGEWKSWYINGELKEIGQWKNGVQHGRYKAYYDNGKVMEMGGYKRGVRDGKVYKFSETGDFYIEKYKRGELVAKKEKKAGVKFHLPFRKKKKSKEQPAQDVTGTESAVPVQNNAEQTEAKKEKEGKKGPKKQKEPKQKKEKQKQEKKKKEKEAEAVKKTETNSGDNNAAEPPSGKKNKTKKKK